MSSLTADQDRRIRFQAIRNFRDYGGYALPGGGRLRRGALFRSAGQHEATPEDLDALARLGLVAIIDLRGAAERERHPCRRPVGFSAAVHAVEERTDGLLGPLLAEAQAQPGELDTRKLMREGYAAMPFRWRMKGVLRLYFSALARSDGPSPVHCHAGKDRTGLAVALLHSALGVHRDDVVADYLLTNIAADIDARFATEAPFVRAVFGESLNDAQLRDLVGVRPEYIEAALDAIEARHGAVRPYLADHLGVPDADLERIAQQLAE